MLSVKTDKNLRLLAITLIKRGGTYKVSPVDETTLKIVNTQTWRLRADHYSGGCEQSDVTNQVQVFHTTFQNKDYKTIE